MIAEEKIIEQIDELLDKEYLGVLATQGQEYPYCTLVGIAALPGRHEILFATIRDTRKFQHIRQAPQVSLLIDTRQDQASDFKDAQALTILGQASPVPESNQAVYYDCYLKKHPYLKEFVASPNCALMTIHVKRYILVSRFQNVFEYHVT